jgi:enoyl-CoA hydratase/carnithine racemase
MNRYGVKFHMKRNVGVVTVNPPSNGNGTNYDPKIVLHAIREKVQRDESIKLIFITGDGNRGALIREIFEVDEKMAHEWLRRMKRKKKRSRRVKNERLHLTHAAALLNI